MLEKNKHKYFIQQYLFDTPVYNGGVGYSDIEKILKGLGFQEIIFPHHYNFSVPAKISRLWFGIKCLLKLPAGSVIIFQLPVYTKLHRLFISWLYLFRKKVKLVCCVSDIDGLKDGDAVLFRKEMRFLKKMHHLVVHNTQMKNMILQHVPKASVAQIDFFDFLTEPFDFPVHRLMKLYLQETFQKAVF